MAVSSGCPTSLVAKSGQKHLFQFAKSTMEAAQSLYGVTMQEPGVSKVVSVRFHPLEQPPPMEQVAVAVV